MKLVLAFIFIMTVCLSCKDERPQGPQQIYYGEDVCERCKMIISEEKFSSQYVLEDGHARKFDDLGCMIEYISSGEPGEAERNKIKNSYVRDYGTGEWIDGNSAYYIHTESIKTPMGYGIITFRDKLAADGHADKESGTMLGGLDNASSYIHEHSKE